MQHTLEPGDCQSKIIPRSIEGNRFSKSDSLALMASAEGEHGISGRGVVLRGVQQHSQHAMQPTHAQPSSRPEWISLLYHADDGSGGQ